MKYQDNQFVVDVTFSDTMGMVVAAKDEAQVRRVIDMAIEAHLNGTPIAQSDDDQMTYEWQREYLSIRLQEIIDTFTPTATVFIRKEGQEVPTYDRMIAFANESNRITAEYKALLLGPDGVIPHYHQEAANDLAHEYMRLVLSDTGEGT
jgi:hypothetical protein